jgi:hypothetical protein
MFDNPPEETKRSSYDLTSGIIASPLTYHIIVCIKL